MREELKQYLVSENKLVDKLEKVGMWIHADPQTNETIVYRKKPSDTDPIDCWFTEKIGIIKNVDGKAKFIYKPETKYVYLVVYDWQDPSFNGEKTEEIFDNYKKAKEQFNKLVADDKEEGLGSRALNGNNQFIIDANEEDVYFAFEDGYATSKLYSG